VTAVEYDGALAERARENLAPVAQVSVIHGDGTSLGFDAADAIYVNAGVTRPPDAWLDRLKDGGRLVVPLTTDRGFNAADPSRVAERGAFFAIKRRGTAFAARSISAVAIFPCVGARDAASEEELANAFNKGGWEFVRSLHRGRHGVPYERCWLWAEDWCLAYDEVA